MRRYPILLATACLALLVGSGGPATAVVRGATGAPLSGAEEVPPADPDGTGAATFRLDPDVGSVCYNLRVARIAPATAAHIHQAPKGSNGPIVVHLVAPTNGASSGCVRVSPALVQNLIDDPEAYYVNVHNAPYPGGAVRGQLR